MTDNDKLIFEDVIDIHAAIGYLTAIQNHEMNAGETLMADMTGRHIAALRKVAKKVDEYVRES